MNIFFERKRNLKAAIISMSYFCFSFIGMQVVYANTSGRVPVTYIKTESVTYPLYVDVSGDGEILNGQEILRNKKQQYLLAVDESMTFELKADSVGKLESVKLNNEDAMYKVKDNKITVEGAEKKQTLSLRFEAGNSSKLPHTGDNTKLGTSILFALISFVLLGYMCYKERKKLNGY